MHRFYASVENGQVHFRPSQVRQIRTVLRLRDGDEVAVFDGNGSEWVARLTPAGAEAIRPSNGPVEPQTQLTLYQALIRPAQFEYVLQKGTELGVARFVPVTAQRSVRTGLRLGRWRSIVVEAAEQSGRRIVPEITPPHTLQEAVEEAARTSTPFMPWEGALGPKLASVHRQSRELALIIGPEGGFTPAEVEQARGCGAVTVSLGPRILRSETAAIVAATILLHLNNEI